MSDDDTDPGRRPADGDAATEVSTDSGEARGVYIPTWLAGALVVVLALVVAGVGFAIGRATAPDADGGRVPALIGEPPGPGAPGPGGGPGFEPRGPGGQDSPGAGRERPFDPPSAPDEGSTDPGGTTGN